MSLMPAIRGNRQRRVLASPENPHELVYLSLRVEAHLRTKAHAAAAVAGVSTTVLVEQWLASLEVPEPAQTPLPLAESA